MPLDSFIENHLTFIIGELIKPKYGVEDDLCHTVTSPETKAVHLKNSPEMTSYNIPTAIIEINEDFKNETEVENWHGLVNECKKPLKKRKASCIDADPTIKLVKDNCSAARVIGLLKNGNVSDLRLITIEKKQYSIENTCAFHSIFQTMGVAFADSKQFRLLVTENQSSVFFLDGCQFHRARHNC